jgi:UDP-N-acetylglucosamine--N-acetylmuramyl-(pentapeptide) pyrophosphoryl-undecaprenol N-acetylglucosamine transferase
MNSIDTKYGDKIVISAGGTGGHIFPALSIIKQIKDYKIIIITDIRGELYFKNFFKTNNKQFNHTIFTYKVTSPSNKNLLKRIISIYQFLLCTLKSIKLFVSQKPNIIIGFGGYPPVAPVIAGKILKIPVIIHEQNIILGRANRFLCKFSNILALSFKTTKLNNIKINSIYSGNPIREEFHKIGELGYKIPTLNGKFIILIIGGSLGANYFSSQITDVLCSLPTKLKKRLLIFHQVVDEEIIRVKKIYKINNINSEVKAFFDDISIKFKKAHLIISRSGGSSISEILASNRPAILIPLPTALDNHQEANAKFISRFNGGWLIDQNKITTKEFKDIIEDFMLNPKKLKEANHEIKKVYDSNIKHLKNMHPTEFIVQIIKNLINKNQVIKRVQ